MNEADQVIVWLLEGDPAIRWQVQRDLLDANPRLVSQERALTVESGWGARLLALQDPHGTWGGGLYSPKWISTTYTCMLLRRIGLPPGTPQALEACRILLDGGFYPDGGINYIKSYTHSETCITGMILSILAYFQYEDERLSRIVKHLLDQQMNDGGWNCQSYQGATHSSFHTTISVLEGLWLYQQWQADKSGKLSAARQRAHEFLLLHKLYRSHRTGDIVHPAFTRFSFPPRWHYDILRALDYFQDCRATPHPGMQDAAEVLERKRKPDGCWVLQNRYAGRTFFEMETVGQPSRWNTLRALRVLHWWQAPPGVLS